MAKYFLTVLFLAFCLASFAQLALEVPPSKPPKPLTKRQAKAEDENHNCLHRNKYSLSERLNFIHLMRHSKFKLFLLMLNMIQLH